MRRRVGLLIALLTGSAAAQLPVAVIPGPRNAPDIVVTGRAGASAEQVVRQATAISRVDDTASEALARFAAPVCPGIAGLPGEVAALMVDRIRYDVERVGARLDQREGCKPNIIINFVLSGQTQVVALMRTKPYLFAGLETPEMREIESERGPVRAWHITRLRTRFDEVESPSLQQGPVRFNGGVNLGPIHVVMVPSSDSKLFLASKPSIEFATVVIDAGAIDGLSVDQIADHAAMRALARTRPLRGDTAANTILTLFEPGGRRAAGLTDFDLAYLRSLYDENGNVPAVVKIGGVARQMAKADAAARP